MTSTLSTTLAAAANLHEGHFAYATLHSLAMVIATEIGDKTFFIAAILAMSRNPLHVFLGCWSALATMTVLSGRKARRGQSSII